MSNHKNVKMLTPVAVESIKNKVLAYKKLMNDIADYIDGNTTVKPVINRKTQYLQFYIDKDALIRMAKIISLKNFDSMGVFFGLDNDKNDKLTACFLGVDKNKKILPGHFQENRKKGKQIFTTEGVLGEENWPPPPNSEFKKGVIKAKPMHCFNLESKDTSIEKFFSAPVIKKK